MTASWLFAYSSVRQLPMSFSGAVKASGPIWTLMGGMLVFSEFLSNPQFKVVLVSILRIIFVTEWEISKHFNSSQPATYNDAACNNPVHFCSPHDKRCRQGKHPHTVCDGLFALGLAERLAINGMIAGQTIPQYTPDAWLGNLHKLRMEIITQVRLFGIDAEDAYFQHTVSGKPMVLEAVDTLVTAVGHTPNTELEKPLIQPGIPHQLIGGSLSPRTAEEAILEGLRVGATL